MKKFVLAVIVSWMLVSSVQAELKIRDLLDLALVPPELKINPTGFNDEDRDYNMVIGVERAAKGRIWAATISGEDGEGGYLVVWSSDDDGKTWSKPRLVIKPESAACGLFRRTLIACLWTDPSGKLWLFFDQSMGAYDSRSGVWYTTCSNPDAENPEWSHPIRFGHGNMLNKPIVLQDGTWLLPVSHQLLCDPGASGRRFLSKEALAEFYQFGNRMKPLQGAHVYASYDAGKTFQRIGSVRFPHFAGDEHMLIEKKDGTLWMLGRTGRGIDEAFSTDGGKTWSEPKFAIPHTVSRFFIRRLASGNLLLVKHGGFGTQEEAVQCGRNHLTAYLSEDDGKTWKGGLELDVRSISYPDGFQHPDGRIFIAYDFERSRAAEVRMAVFTEADVLAGKDVSGKVRLHEIISKATKKNQGK
ncbi:MAG: sialidase family protein [Planctomycetia bacterium]|nr:sialidase family protein [Planctomycetia bacterium]